MIVEKPLVTNGTVREEMPFPKLMISRTGTIILFFEYNKGILLVAGEKYHNPKLGDYCDHFSMDSFIDFVGEIQLTIKQNKE